MYTKKSVLPKAKPELPTGYNEVTISSISKPFEKPDRDGYWSVITFRSADGICETKFHCPCIFKQYNATTELFSAVVPDFSFDNSEDACLSDLAKKKLIVKVEKVFNNGRAYHNITQFLPLSSNVKVN